MIESADREGVFTIGEQGPELQIVVPAGMSALLEDWQLWSPDAAHWVPDAAEPTEDGRCELRGWFERHLGYVLEDWQWEWWAGFEEAGFEVSL